MHPPTHLADPPAPLPVSTHITLLSLCQPKPITPPQLDVSALSVGDLVWKNRDPAVEAQLRASYDGKGSSKLRKTLVQVRA